MGYKGEDLDLRTSQLWSAATSDALDQVSREDPEALNSGWPRSASMCGLGTGPIWIDETVMACCNQAYDLAVAHRAAEVRLEHLLNAMTLVEAAVRILEQRRILVAALRRDTGAMIATALPVGSSTGKKTPPRSLEFEQALRLAAERAYPGQTRVTTEELLLALLDMNRELAAIQLLHHHVADGSPRGLIDQHFAEPQGPRAQMRVAAGSVVTSEPPAEVEGAPADPARQGGCFDDRLTTLERTIETGLGELTRTGSVLADRLRSLEQAVQASSENPIVPGAISEQLKSLDGRQRKLDEVEHTLSLLLDRMTGFEYQIKDRAMPEATDLAPIGERLAALERTIASKPPVSVDLGAVEGRLQGIAAYADETGRSVALVADRVKGIEDALAAQLPQLASGIRAEIEGLAKEIGALQVQGERLPAQFAERLEALTAVIEGQGDAVASKTAATVVERVASVGATLQEALTAVIEGQGDAVASKTAATVVERVASVGATLQAQGEDLPVQVKERFHALAAIIEGQGDAVATKVGLPLVERLASLGSDIHALAEKTEVQQAQGERLLGQLTERLQALAVVIERQGDALAAKIATPLEERLANLGASLEQTRAGIGPALGKLADRLGTIDRAFATCVQLTSDLQAAHTRDVPQLRDALLTVNGNQQTIATAVDQWRMDTAGDLGVISNRLEALDALERANARPLELIESLCSTVHDLHRLQEKQEEQRRTSLRTDHGNGARSRAGTATAAEPPREAGSSESHRANHKSWMRQAMELVRRRRAK